MIWKFNSSKSPNSKLKPRGTSTLKKNDVETCRSREKSRLREMQLRKWVQEKVLTGVFKWGCARIDVFLKHVLGMQPGAREVTSKCCLTGGRKDFDAAKETEELPSNTSWRRKCRAPLWCWSSDQGNTIVTWDFKSARDSRNWVLQEYKCCRALLHGHFFCHPT